MNEPLLVEARVGRDGRLRPRSFVWSAQRYTVASIGRQWTDASETHVLVTVEGSGTYELAYSLDTGAWRLARSPEQLGPPASV